jgi:NAD(P)-dependent dehydrogenase (short-subunit alcohol dehydrogenase family)
VPGLHVASDACLARARAQSFLDATPEQLRAVVTTNLQGSLLCTRAALRAMARQPRGGHVFNMDGAGADGMATPQYAAYGATKAGAGACATAELDQLASAAQCRAACGCTRAGCRAAAHGH